MKTIVTGMGRSGTKWLATFLGTTHEACPLAHHIFQNLWQNVEPEKTEFMLNEYAAEFPEGHIEVDSRLRLCVPQLRQRGMTVIGMVNDPRYVIESLYNCNAFAHMPPPDENKVCRTHWESDCYVEKLLMRLGRVMEMMQEQCNHIIRFDRFIELRGEAMITCNTHFNMSFDEKRWEDMRKQRINDTPTSAKRFEWNDHTRQHYREFENRYSDVLKKLGYK